ncbi:MAG: alpha/beta hydrolase [Solirubrobacterales bacterium]|nr:alpha/beta hydrolase [Solirubrobacterales bacterium]
MTLTLDERHEKIAGLEIFWREAAAAGDGAPTLYVHGVPTNCDGWTPFLERTGGVALDLPGFGRSDKPMHFDGSIGSYNALLQAFIAKLGWDRFNLVVEDWGGLALVTAQELHERVNRVVIINAVPLLPGYKWHRLARAWRTPLIGELAMGLTTKSIAKFLTKEARPNRQPLPDEMIESIWEHFDQGTQRAILKLYRSGGSKVLEEAGERFGQLTAPTLVIWGEQDPYIPTGFGALYSETLPNARLELLPDAGHWPWVDRPDVIDMTANFLAGVESPA